MTHGKHEKPKRKPKSKHARPGTKTLAVVTVTAATAVAPGAALAPSYFGAAKAETTSSGSLTVSDVANYQPSWRTEFNKLRESATAKEQAVVPVPAIPAHTTSPSAIAAIKKPPPEPVTLSKATIAVSFALGQIGKPYVWGATGPNSYDCSGLTYAAWAAAGITIPRVSYDQYSALPHISQNELMPGDLVFFDGAEHVGIYIGAGMLIDSPHTGADVEKVSLSNSWFAANYYGAARVQ